MNRFDEAAKTWDIKTSSLNIAKACVENINNTLKMNEIKDILDYGCGTGLVSFSLSNEDNFITGMDNSQGMVEEFNKKTSTLSFSNIKAIKHNINEEDLPLNKYDLITISMTLHHIKDTKMFVEKCKKSLKENSYLCINDLDKEDGTFHKKHNNDGVEHFGFEKEALIKLLEDNGFEIIDYKIVCIDERNDTAYPIFNLIAKS